MSIGEVLGLLRSEFSDVTISKIRFLEEQGLVEPDRSPAGYRKFSHADVERLRYVLAMQRDHYLPLRIIREHLDAVDHGQNPARTPRLVADGPTEGRERLERPERRDRGTDVRLSRADLLELSGAGEKFLAELEAFGVITTRRGTGHYDGDALAVVRVAVELADFGIEPRHLRPFRMAAEREAGLVEQVVTPLRRQRGPEAQGRADEVGHEVAALCLRLHAVLIKVALDGSGH